MEAQYFFAHVPFKSAMFKLFEELLDRTGVGKVSPISLEDEFPRTTLRHLVRISRRCQCEVELVVSFHHFTAFRCVADIQACDRVIKI